MRTGWDVRPPAVAALLSFLLLLSIPAFAGDILRGGATRQSDRERHAAAQRETAAEAARARANAQDAMRRTTNALQDVQRMQAAARAAATGRNNLGPDPNNPGNMLPNVPDGLAPGGLQVDPGVFDNTAPWNGAMLPSQSVSSGRALVNIRQTQEQALLSWRTFNVGRNTTVNFDQSAGGRDSGRWIAFNRVNDPSGVPSQILGRIQAPGQVYLINQNGIIFGGTSQINVRTLVATSLPINENLIDRGLLNQSQTVQFLFSGLPQTGDVPFTPPPPPPSGRYGDVIVHPGAQLVSQVNEANVGGRIALIGANVSNQGTISTPAGQAILAAGLQVGWEAHDANDPSLRGLDTYIGQVGDYAGTAINTGWIDAPRGNITITGRDVRQFGAATASTSVSLNGRIDLRAEYNASANPVFNPAAASVSPPFLYGGVAGGNTGSVTFGPHSVTRILPEYGTGEKITGSSLALRSQVNVRGLTTRLERGAMIHAPSGQVNIESGVWDFAPSSTSPRTTFVRSGGWIHLGPESMINVAGTPDAFSPLSNHILTVTLRGSELADSPLQRFGLLRGGDITVDLRRRGVYNGFEWVGTPLADLRGYLNLIERTVEELTVAGGTINLRSGGAVNIDRGAKLDLSGGWLNYGGGMVQTTRLWYRGHLIDIADATPNRLYDAIFSGLFTKRHERWGIEKTWEIPFMHGRRYEQPYLDGAAAGALSAAGSAMALDGELLARAVRGPRQWSEAPQGGALDLSFEVRRLVPGAAPDPLFSPTPPEIVFTPDRLPAQSPPPADNDPAWSLNPIRTERFNVSPALFTDGGFSSLKIRNPDGNVRVPRGVTVELPPKGSLVIDAANVRIAGDIIAPGGDIRFQVYNISPIVAYDLGLTIGATLPAPNPDRGRFLLESGARLDAAGLIVDQRRSGFTPSNTPAVTTGGTVSIQTYEALLGRGSIIDVSGGVLAKARGGMEYGDAGTIEIIAARDLSIPAVDGGRLVLGSTLRGFSGARGGTLTLQAQLIRIGALPSHPLALMLKPSFFNEGGFATFNLSGIGLPGESEDKPIPAIHIAPGTRIEPKALGWLALPHGAPDGSTSLVEILRPEGLRSPVSLSFNALGSFDNFSSILRNRGDILMDRGSSILTDALGSVSFNANTVAILGSITAPGGSISLAGGARLPGNVAAPVEAFTTLYIGPGARLSTAGKAITLYTHPRGWRSGFVTPGGTISLSGNIVAERGAVFDVSGARGVFDLPHSFLGVDQYPQTSLNGLLRVPVPIETDGGAIIFRGSEFLYSDARLIGQPGGPSARGGSVIVSSGRFIPAGSAFTSADENLIVQQTGVLLPAGVPRGPGMPLRDAANNPLQGIGRFSLSSIARGGFDGLALDGNVTFQGPVSVAMPGWLRVGTGGVIRADSDVRLAAPYVALGQPFRPPVLPGQEPVLFTRTDTAGTTTPYFFAPTWGTGSLTVLANLIDIGNLSLNGIGRAALRAPGGDIRGSGTLNIAGNLLMQAGQIYPTTLGNFQVFAYNHTTPDGPAPGSITILGGARRDLPMTAAGRLALYASEIHQGGVLRAPFGRIDIGWLGTGTAPVNPIAGTTLPIPQTATLTLAPGSITSVSGIDPRTGQTLLVPFGLTRDEVSWLDPAGNDLTLTGPPQKAINFAAGQLTIADGATVDISGGGDLLAYRWVEGLGGTRDILANPNVFAIIPGYGFGYAPYGAYNPTLGSTAGYTNSNLAVGDTITLGAAAGLRAGTYTLLPARYATLPGAFLVTPLSGDPVGSFAQPDGSWIVNGFMSSGLGQGGGAVTRMGRFEIAPRDTTLTRAEYRLFTANDFLRQAALNNEQRVPRLPIDAGYLSFTATSGMFLGGQILAGAPPGGRGGKVDINSPVNILINRDGTPDGSGALVLSASQLSSFRAESLLIGGLRRPTIDGDVVTVGTGNIRVDNAGAPLTGTEIILVARESMRLEDGSSLAATGSLAFTDPLILGSDATPGSGDGLLLRVSAAPQGDIIRRGVSVSNTPLLEIGPNVVLSGQSLALDSTARATIDPTAQLISRDILLSAGRISMLLNPAASPGPDPGMVLAGDVLASLQANALRLRLQSYSSFDLYGDGQFAIDPASGQIILSTPLVRGFAGAGETSRLTAGEILISNTSGRTDPGLAGGAPLGSLILDANRITLGRGDTRITGYATTTLDASGGILTQNIGNLLIDNNIILSAPVLAGAAGSNYSITSTGSLLATNPGTAPALTGGLGARLALTGSTLAFDTSAILPSGDLSLTATTGDLRVGTSGPALIDLRGTTNQFIDITRHTSGGTLRLNSNTGNILVGPAASIDVSAQSGGGNGGAVIVSSPQGGFTLDGSLLATPGAGGAGGRFSFDAATIPGGSVAALDARLNAGQFTAERIYRLRTGDLLIDGSALSRIYRATADQGDLIVSGTIDASGRTGGRIDLTAAGSLVLENDAILDARGQIFDNAGKGGAVSLTAGAPVNGVIDPAATLVLNSGSQILLGVEAWNPMSAFFGRFQGTLHLRAPRNAANTDLALAPIESSISGASAILVEGFRRYQTNAAGDITAALRTTMLNEANAFLGTAGATTAGYTAMLNRLTSAQPGLDLILAPGIELQNPAGPLVLGTASSAASNDWNLATWRFGPRSAPGVLTLRARDDINLFNALSDGFGGGASLWLSPLLPFNPLLPANTQSWSLRLTAGSDLAGASHTAIRPGTGFLNLGKNMGAATASPSGASATTASLIGNNFNVIRTGSGDIEINAGQSIRLLNPFASIYTAGTQVPSATSIYNPNDFVLPVLNLGLPPLQGNLGAYQQSYFAQYSMAGGNVSLAAATNIERLTRNNIGLIEDSSRQLPNNWLYRRGFVGPDGTYGTVIVGAPPRRITDPGASTTWWVDFSNFFQSVGALGGGNVTLSAGADVRNVDAVIPTNARAPLGAPDPSLILELGGGDLVVRSGNDISAGIYYVERGTGILDAGGAITTNATRSPSLGIIANLNNPQNSRFDSETWLPTTLFLGKSSFSVTSRGDLLLGPATNPFFLPQGLNNRFWYKSWFSTFSPDASVTATSLGGDVTLRNAATLPSARNPQSILRLWLESQNLLTGSNNTAAFTQPWLRLTETSVAPFSTLTTTYAPSLRLTSLSRDINLVGTTTLFPSASGALEFVARGAVNALRPTGVSNSVVPGQSTRIWSSAIINMSDSNPAAFPSATSPLNYFSLVGGGTTSNNTTNTSFLLNISRALTESGSFSGPNAVAQIKQARHTPGLLHGTSPEPLRLYAMSGDISGLTLFSPKFSNIHAGRDISDIAFYLQNNRVGDFTTVSAGRDIVPANAQTPLRTAASQSGNIEAFGESALAGDIQISGPGALVVLAGRNLDLGVVPGFADGTGVGITSIGNLRNPFLPFDGASLIVGAGLGPNTSLGDSRLDFDAFIANYVESAEGQAILAEISPGTDFASLSRADQEALALAVFYRVLRDTGRNFNDPESPGFQNYDLGYDAIASLFGQGPWNGEILTQSRNIRTRNGGDISIFAPGGGLTMADTTIGNPLAPPGIITDSGGSIGIFTDQSVSIGIGRIFTLRGGDITIWSSTGDIAAGAASKTVASAPPTRVVIDPQSADVSTDLAGLATGGGIGVLATVANVPPGDVDLIAPQGIIDAGDAGIRVSGNINLAATQVLNAGNIAIGGTAQGAPAAPAVAAPALGGLAASPAAAAAAAASTAATTNEARQEAAGPLDNQDDSAPSIITVEVLGYGGGRKLEEDEEEDESRPEEEEEEE